MPEFILKPRPDAMNSWHQPIGLAQPRQYQERQPTPDHLNHQKRLAEIGQCSAEMVHEIRNTLASILITLDHFKTLELEPASQQRLDLGLEATHQLCGLTHNILGHVQPQRLALQWTDLNSLSQSLLAEMAMLPMAQDRSLKFECSEAALVAQVDPGQFQRALVNLLSNALEAIQPGQTVFCTLRESESRAIVEIRNVVESVAPAILRQWSQPFYSTKPDGTGLGLMVAQRVIEDHGGQLNISSDSPGMVTVAATLPLLQCVATPQESSWKPPASQSLKRQSKLFAIAGRP